MMLSRLSMVRLVRPQGQYSVPRLARGVGSVPRLAQVVASRTETVDNTSPLPAEIGNIQMPGNTPVVPPTKETAAHAPANHPTRSVIDSAADVPLVGQQDEFWRKVPVWKDVPASEFLSYRWGVSIYLHVQKPTNPPCLPRTSSLLAAS